MAMDPVSQVLAQQESGSAGGQGFGQFYVEGQRQGLSRRRLDLEMQQESRMQRRDDLMLPLEAKLTQAQIVNLGIQAETTTQKAQTAMRLNLVVPEIYRLENEFMQSPDGHASPALRQEVLNLSRQYPEAFVGDMPGADLWRKMEAVPMFEQRMKRISEMEQKLQGTGSRIESYDPVTGRINLGQRTTPGTLSTVGKEVADLSALETTDPATAARFREAQAQRDASRHVETSVTVGPGGETTTTFKRGGSTSASPGGLTTATQTDLQRRETAGLSSLQTLDRLKTVVANNPNAWGVRGGVGSIVETGKGILDPQAEAPVKKAINDADIAFTQLADSFKVDSGQMSNYERLKLEKAAGITGIGESQRSAQDKIANLEDAVVGRLLRVAKTQGKRVEDTVLRRIPESEIPSLGEEGLLTEEDALRWYRLKRATQQQAR